jgi:hypothetical protein
MVIKRAFLICVAIDGGQWKFISLTLASYSLEREAARACKAICVPTQTPLLNGIECKLTHD